MSVRIEDLRSRLAALEVEVSERTTQSKPTGRPCRSLYSPEPVAPQTHQVSNNKKISRQRSPEPCKTEPSSKGRFKTTFPSSKSALCGATNGGSNDTIRGLLARLRSEEAQHTADKGSLQRELQKERQRAQRAETAARRAQGQRDFSADEVRHLKAALKRRDDVIVSLEDKVRELEIGLAQAELLQQVEEERDGALESLAQTHEAMQLASQRADDFQEEARCLRESLACERAAKERAVKLAERAGIEAKALQEAAEEYQAMISALQEACDLSSWHEEQICRPALELLLTLGGQLAGPPNTEEPTSGLGSESSYY